MIHLGDHNVPNALLFIDKYVQVPRILNPVVLCLDKIPALYASSPAMKQYINNAFGGCDMLMYVLLLFPLAFRMKKKMYLCCAVNLYS